MTRMVACWARNGSMGKDGSILGGVLLFRKYLISFDNTSESSQTRCSNQYRAIIAITRIFQGEFVGLDCRPHVCPKSTSFFRIQLAMASIYSSKSSLVHVSDTCAVICIEIHSIVTSSSSTVLKVVVTLCRCPPTLELSPKLGLYLPHFVS